MLCFTGISIVLGMATVGEVAKFVSVDLAAAIIGCTEGRVRQLLRAGELVGLKLNERAWAVERKSAERYAEREQPTGRPKNSARSA